jgi:hypothetical protein
VLSTPPAFVLSQNQTLQTKTTHANARDRNPNQKNLTNQPEKNLAKQKHHTLTRGSQSTTKNKQQTKTTKHTIEFSNNTPACIRSQGNPTSVLQLVVLSQIGLSPGTSAHSEVQSSAKT